MKTALQLEKDRESKRRYWHKNKDTLLPKQNQWYQENRESILSKKKEYDFQTKKNRMYNVDIDMMLLTQGNACAICSEQFTESMVPHVDHDHKCCGVNKSCGECVRGLLCINCNHMLGKAKDSPYRLLAAIQYLKEVC